MEIDPGMTTDREVSTCMLTSTSFAAISLTASFLLLPSLTPN